MPLIILVDDNVPVEMLVRPPKCEIHTASDAIVRVRIGLPGEATCDVELCVTCHMTHSGKVLKAYKSPFAQVLHHSDAVVYFATKDATPGLA